MTETVSGAYVIGEIDGSVERKTVREKKLAEFRVAGLGLKIVAWEQRADQVPDSGRVLVQGYLNTRTYTHDGQERSTTEIRATNIQAIDAAADAEPF